MANVIDVQYEVVCAVEGCGNTADHWGFCIQHYSKIPADKRLALTNNVPGSLEAGVAVFNLKLGESIIATSGEEEGRLATYYVQDALKALENFNVDAQWKLDLVNSALKTAKEKAKTWEEREKRITGPLLKELETARSIFRPARTLMVTLEATLKKMILDFAAIQDARNKEQMQTATEAAAEGDQQGFDAAIEKVATVEALEKISIRKSWDFRITDPKLVPRHLCMPDEKAIKVYMKQTSDKETAPPEVPGVEFYLKETVVSR